MIRWYLREEEVSNGGKYERGRHVRVNVGVAHWDLVFCVILLIIVPEGGVFLWQYVTLRGPGRP